MVLEMDRVIPTRRRARRRTTPASTIGFRPRRYLLTRCEADFFRVLWPLLGNRYLISCKVRLADLVTCSASDWAEGKANRISQKHIDFVVSCAHSSRIMLAIELDDRSHERPERKRRDTFLDALLAETGIRFLRVTARSRYDAEALRDELVRKGLRIEREIDRGSTSPKPKNLKNDPSN